MERINMESSEVQIQNLNLQLSSDLTKQIEGLVGFTFYETDDAIINEHESKQEIPIAEDYLPWLIRTIRRQPAPVSQEYQYTKKVAVRATTEGNPYGQYCEIRASWVNDYCQFLTVKGLKTGESFRIVFDKKGQVTKAFGELADGSEKELSAEELAAQVAQLGDLKLDPGTVNWRLNKKTEEDLRAQGGDIKIIGPDDQPDLPKIVLEEPTQAVGPNVATGRTSYLVKRPDGQGIIVQASRTELGLTKFPDSREAIAAALSFAPTAQAKAA